jgi:hypothetical protein
MPRNQEEEELAEEKRLLSLEQRMLERQKMVDEVAKKSFILRNQSARANPAQEELDIV